MRDDALDQPHPARLSIRHPRFTEIMARHAEAVSAGLPAYRDPTSGFAVFTAAFLAERGTCCSSGCRHCPYVTG
ncbi:MAG: hypothetical protein JWM34_1712 [Ilumatobacteraceae bacterium]|nr:hypothetical protein [Ilumatobacteraceae bacterium]